MNPHDSAAPVWARAMDAFDAWVQLPAASQAERLEAIRSADPILAEHLESLIHADSEAQANVFLDPRAAPAPSAGGGLEGQLFGPWQIERFVGSGGMGQVWLARRTDGLYEGLAAIKLIRTAAQRPGTIERFAREGRLLGRLNHPNIARLLDAGVTASGERYLVLEYVEGERIDAWCDRLRLVVDARVRLFVDVCEAVAHAQEHLIVHRDIKPSNIFVTQSGAVKLLDFGVAKLLADDDDAESSELTRDAGAALTPQYAAPEQLTGGTVSTATDVYGLGAVLFRLLNGGRPYTADAADADEPRPLSALPGDRDAVSRIAEERGTSVAALRRTLRGDLSVVVAKALKRNIADRYRAASDLSADLSRVLERQPISARADAGLYRLRRYVQRHAFGVGASALIIAAVVTGLTATLVKQREAERQAARAIAVKRFVLELFEEANVSASGGVQKREATLNDMLASGGKRIERAFAEQPEIRDEIYETLISLYSETGDQTQMTRLAEQRLAAARSAFGDSDPRTAPADIALAAVELNFGARESAKAHLAQAQSLLDRAGDASSIHRARLLRWQGVYAQFHEPERPWPGHPMQQAVRLYRDRYPEEDDFLEALQTVPMLACRGGDVEEARAAAEELFRRAQARYGADSLFTTEATAARGRLETLSGRPEAAIPLLEKALAGFRKFTGESSPDVVFTSLLLGEALVAANRPSDAQHLFEVASTSVARDHADDKRLKQRLVTYKATIARIADGHPPRCGE